MLKVNRRGGFSDRQGINPINTNIQINDFDQRTRVQLFNLVSNLYKAIYGNRYWGDTIMQEFFYYVYQEIFCETVNAGSYISDDRFFKDMKGVFLNASYDDILTFIEAISDYWEDKSVYTESGGNSYGSGRAYTIPEVFNTLFEKEYIGYRFVNGKISPISDEMEANTITETLNDTYAPVSLHISKAHTLLADREQPDYENSIKESISAVEAMCEIITGIKGKEATLGTMLKKLESKGVVIHSALKSAFNTLYGYTSDANGIRHAGDIGGEASTFEEAKFMLISCCAFINYLKGVNAD